MNDSPPTIRPDLIGKTVVRIYDPRSHGDGRIPPSAILGEFVAAEADYAAIRCLRSSNGHDVSRLDFQLRVSHDYNRYEPGELLESYLPGYVKKFGQPDFVLREYAP
jgi:hypothetical protein